MYKKIIIIAIVAIGFVSCRKDESNVTNPDQLNSNNYPKTLGDLQSFLIPGYSNFRSANLYGYQYLPIILSSDHSFCSQNSGGNPFGIQGGDFLTNNVGVTNTPNTALYSQLYQGVAAMNVFFDRAKFYLQSNPTDVANVNALRGQAYFLRGYYFYLLECLYGEQFIDMKQAEDPNVLGIPLPIVFASSVPETDLPRSSAFQTWTRIINDFELSAQYLHGVTYSTANSLPGQGQGMVTEWAADGMLGKSFVFTKQYDSAKTYLLKVINNGVNSLVPFNVYANSFNGNTANEFNKESLFEINVDRQQDQAGIMFSNSYQQSLTTDAGELWAPTIIGSAGVDSLGNGDGNGGTSTNMGNGYCKFFVHDKCLRRFGFTLPVYTYDRNQNAVGVNSAASPIFIMDSVSRRKSLEIRTNNTVDPRLFVCAMEPWIDSCEQPYTVSTNVPPSSAAQFPDTIPVGKAAIINTSRSSFWGWSFKKYATTQDAILAYGGNDASNLLLLRLADVYLLYAEACINTGDDPDALIYINKVHERAYNGSSAYDYSSVTAPTLADPSDADLANNPLAYERYVELFGEGGWWFDVCRWGIGSREASYFVYGASEYDPLAGTGPANSIIDANNWSGSGSQIQAEHFPIPSAEIATNPSIQRNNYPY